MPRRICIASPGAPGLQNSHIDVVPLGDVYLVSMKLCFTPGNISALPHHSSSRRFEHQLTQGVHHSLEEAIGRAISFGVKQRLPVLVRRPDYEWFERELLYEPPGWKPRIG